MKLTFVTSNEHKAREAALTLGVEIERVKLELDEIQSLDLRAIVEHKVRQAYEQLKEPVMVEDVSFEIKKWNRFPGPLIKWLHESMGYDELCKILGDDRRVDWRVMYGYYDGTEFISTEAVVAGHIAERPREGGWGFDVIFIPDGETKTLGELGIENKLKRSARSQALFALRDVLNSRA